MKARNEKIVFIIFLLIGLLAFIECAFEIIDMLWEPKVTHITVDKDLSNGRLTHEELRPELGNNVNDKYVTQKIKEDVY